MKINENTITFIVPTEKGESYELNFDETKAKKVELTKPMIQVLSQNTVAIATTNNYDLIMLDL